MRDSRSARIAVALGAALLALVLGCQRRESRSLTGPLEMARESLRRDGLIGMTPDEAGEYLIQQGLASRFRESRCANLRFAAARESVERPPNARYVIASKPTLPRANRSLQILLVVRGDEVVDVTAGFWLGLCWG